MNRPAWEQHLENARLRLENRRLRDALAREWRRAELWRTRALRRTTKR